MRTTLIATLILLLLAGCTDRKSVRRSISAAEAKMKPVIAAIKQYRTDTGSYPEDLDVLVAAGLLDEEPALPIVSDADESGPYYKIKDGGGSYSLSISYHLHKQGFGLGDTTYSTWRPDGNGWSRSRPGY